jgi:hypothetical protein
MECASAVLIAAGGETVSAAAMEANVRPKKCRSQRGHCPVHRGLLPSLQGLAAVATPRRHFQKDSKATDLEGLYSTQVGDF